MCVCVYIEIFFEIDCIPQETNTVVWMLWGRTGIGEGRGNEWK